MLKNSGKGNFLINFALNLPRALKGAIFLILDVVTCYLSVWLSFGVRLNEWVFFDSIRLNIFFIAVIVSIPLFFINGLYKEIFRFIGIEAVKSLVRVFKWYFIIFLCFFITIANDQVPGSICVIQPLIYFLTISMLRYAARIFFVRRKLISSTNFAKFNRVLIYGAGSAGRELATTLKANQEYTIVGFIDDDFRLNGGSINGLPVFDSSNVKQLVKKKNVNSILLALPSASQSQRNLIIKNLSHCNVRVCTIPSLSNLVSGLNQLDDVNELDMNDLLGREPVKPHMELLTKNIQGKVVLVTGAGGSIGSELCRQILRLSPTDLVLIDSSEFNLFLIYEELKALVGIESAPFSGKLPARKVKEPFNFNELKVNIYPYLISVCNEIGLAKIFKIHNPNTVFHAAAYKHVPLIELNPLSAIQNNIFGTLKIAKISQQFGVSHLVFISTDKAVRPTNIMGATKRVAEQILQSIADDIATNVLMQDIKFVIVRFGNVLGSSGSVVPLFHSQIKTGGPITLTHPDVTRYFMTIPEAAELVIQSGAMACGGDIFLLDMGDPVKIYDLALKMIYLSGKIVKDQRHINGDIEIKITGLRPGEKLYEELLIGSNPEKSEHPKIMKANEKFLSWNRLDLELEKLQDAINLDDVEEALLILSTLVPEYRKA
jgi:FlaA1/EpsC-like NDP-sugar epimerase